jgi:hypothetical protein
MKPRIRLSLLLLSAIIVATASAVNSDGVLGRKSTWCPDTVADLPSKIICEGRYKWHLQGVDSDGQFLYWSFSDRVVKSDKLGRRVAVSAIDKLHYGDLCVVDGVVYVAFNGGEFNKETGALNRVLAFKASDLSRCGEWDIPEVVHGCGGITFADGCFYVVGGLPPNHVKNYVYRYTKDFKFDRRIDLDTGYTMLGIQTINFMHDEFLVGIYPDRHDPEIGLLRFSKDFSDFERLSIGAWVGAVEIDGKFYQARDEANGPEGTNRETGVLYLASFPKKPSEPFTGGLWKTFTYPEPDTKPILFSGWSRSENAKAADYGIFLDVGFADGTWYWDAAADFPGGTHTWRRAAGVFVPEKPVKEVKFYALLRHGVGKAEFRNLKLERRESAPGGEIIVENVRSDFPYSDGEAVHEIRLDGRKVTERDYVRPASIGAPRVARDFPAGKAVVWTASSMRKVTPLTFPSTAEMTEKNRRIDLELAGNERESAQILVSAGKGGAWKSGTLKIGTLTDKSGREFRGEIKWERVGYVTRGHEGLIHPGSPDPAERWIPDPLKVRENATQGLWLTVYAAPDATPGLYCGIVEVRENGDTMASIPLSIKVCPFALPRTFGTLNSFTVMDSFTRAQYPDCFEKMKRQSWDVMLDHRLNPDNISRTTPPDVEHLKYAVKRGLNLFNILNVVSEPKDPNVKIVYEETAETYADPKFYEAFAQRLKPYVEEYRKAGLLKYAYVYGFDERESDCFPWIADIYRKYKRDFPDVPLLSVARAYEFAVNGKADEKYAYDADWCCPNIRSYQPEFSARMREKGRKVWWYSTVAPFYPGPNFDSLESVPLEGRMLVGFMTDWRGADGFLYWHVNYWPNNAKCLDESDTFFPDWPTYTPRSRYSSGGGVLLYPGAEHVLPSIRFAMVRDGVEDREWTKLAMARSGEDRTRAVLTEAVRSVEDYERDPEKLLKIRSKIGALISEGKPK